MSAARRGFYYKRLKNAGIPLEKPYREYKLDELREAHDLAVEQGVVPEPTPEELAQLEQRARAPRKKAAPAPPPADPAPQIPVKQADPNELPGQRVNTKPDEEPIRIDEQGRIWLQEEVRKPAYPKPRGRRVLRYMDPGVKKQTVKVGEYTETFEVAGDPQNATPSEVKITLPSYQVGTYRDRRFPFKIHTYNGNQGFDFFEVGEFYGGTELVPPGVKRMYVENVLCYDMRSVIRAIESEYRQRQLMGGNK
jgi:hypothetical protein